MGLFIFNEKDARKRAQNGVTPISHGRRLHSCEEESIQRRRLKVV